MKGEYSNFKILVHVNEIFLKRKLYYCYHKVTFLLEVTHSDIVPM